MTVHPPSNAIRSLLSSEKSAGILLAISALLAIVVYNIDSFRPIYSDILQSQLRIGFVGAEISKPLLLWINDGLMATFFFLVGLELKREILEGNLSSFDRIMLPAAAAIGGMALPALIYWLIVGNDPVLSRGWAIPAATDIAFALGALSLFAKQIPISLKAFLLTLAILDDLGAIIVIAIFYSESLSPVALGLAACFIAVLLLLNRMNYSRTGLYVILGLALWTCVLKSGVHATLAGVIVALTIPLKRSDGAEFLVPIEHAVLPYVKFMVLPVFAFTNAGLPIGDLSVANLLTPLPLGIAMGLLVGKPLGIVAASWIAIKSGATTLPAGCSWYHIIGAGCFAGIGFTMSLFMVSLAFETSDQHSAVRVGVLYGSIIAAALGSVVMALAAKSRPASG